MKHTLRYCFILLALATTGLFADVGTDPVAPASTSQHKPYRVAKKAHKRHRTPKRHRKRVQ